MAYPGQTEVEAAIAAIVAQVDAEFKKRLANLPPDIQPDFAAFEGVVVDAVTNGLQGIGSIVIKQIMDGLVAGHGPVAKSGVDLA